MVRSALRLVLETGTCANGINILGAHCRMMPITFAYADFGAREAWDECRKQQALS